MKFMKSATLQLCRIDFKNLKILMIKTQVLEFQQSGNVDATFSAAG